MNYENYNELQADYLLMCQNNSSFYQITEPKQFKFINKCLRKRYKADYKKLVKYEKLKGKRINKIFKRNKSKFKVVSNNLAIKMFKSEQEFVSKLNREFERIKFDRKRARLLKRLKLVPKTPTRKTVQGISSELKAREAEAVPCDSDKLKQESSLADKQKENLPFTENTATEQS